MSYGLYVLSAAADGKSNGCIVNTITQVTAEPPKLIAAVHKQNLTAELIERTGLFNAAALTESADMDMIGRFGFRSGRDAEKYYGVSFALDEYGIRYPTQSTAAVFSCKVIDRMDLDTHVLFLGETTSTKILSDEPVMTYDFYHRVRKGSTPPNAPSFKAESGKTGWRCTVCGYIHESDELPDDFICPICKKGADFFEKL